MAKLKFAISSLAFGDRIGSLDFRAGISLSDSTVRLIDSGRMLGIWGNLMDEIITWTDLKMLECVRLVLGNYRIFVNLREIIHF